MVRYNKKKGIIFLNLFFFVGAISVVLGLKLEKTLIIAALRCLIQLTIMVNTHISHMLFIKLYTLRVLFLKMCLKQNDQSWLC